MSWWKRQQRDDNEPQWESSPGQVEVYASHENRCVTLFVSLAEPTAEQEGQAATSLSFPPELAYQLAQRITLAAIKIEEGEAQA